jgi:DNA-damage-inducible protein J
MATKTSNVSFRIDADLKFKAEILFNNLGMNMTTAFNVFLRQAVREGRIPFDVTMNTPNIETIAAILEAERIARDPNEKSFDSVDELIADLNDEI